MRNILKASKYLILKNIILAILLMLITIFVNKLNLTDLTYFNIMNCLKLLASILAYSIAITCSIYINGNGDDNSIATIVKRGLKDSFKAGIILSLILLLTKNLIFKIYSYNPLNDTYFYLMVFNTLLYCIYNYLERILYYVKKFVVSLVMSILEFSLMIGSFIILLTSSKFNLLTIALTYTLTYSTLIILGLIKIIPYLKRPKGSFMGNYNLTLRRMITKEILWQFGIIIISFILLRKSIYLYNAYYYFDGYQNFLLIIYNSITVIGGVQVGHYYAIKKYDEAIKTSKKILLINFISWLIDGILLLACSNFLFKIMNPEIVAVGKKVLIFYLFILLIQIIGWSLNSCILIQGKPTNIMVISSIISFTYVVLCMIFSKYLPSSVWILIIVNISELIPLMTGLSYYLSYKWVQ